MIIKYVSMQIYIYLISNTIIERSSTTVYTSLSLVAFHSVLCCRLSWFQQITVWLKCTAWLIHIDFARKKTVQSVVAELCSSIGVNLSGTWRRRIRYQHCCGQSQIVLSWDGLNMESPFHQQMSSSLSLPRTCQVSLKIGRFPGDVAQNREAPGKTGRLNIRLLVVVVVVVVVL